MNVTFIPRGATVEIAKQHLQVGGKLQNFIRSIESEVKNNPEKATRWSQLLSETATMCVSMLLLAPSPVPTDLTTFLTTAIVVVITLGVGIAIFCLAAASIWKMLFGKHKADDWTMNIVKGLIQLLAAPLLVALIVGIFTLLFSNIPAFQPIVGPIGVFLHQ